MPQTTSTNYEFAVSLGLWPFRLGGGLGVVYRLRYLHTRS